MWFLKQRVVESFFPGKKQRSCHLAMHCHTQCVNLTVMKLHRCYRIIHANRIQKVLLFLGKVIIFSNFSIYRNCVYCFKAYIYCNILSVITLNAQQEHNWTSIYMLRIFESISVTSSQRAWQHHKESTTNAV